MEYTVKSLKREGVAVETLNDESFKEVFEAFQKRLMAKEAIPDVLKWLSANPGKSVSDALSALGIKALTEDELMCIVKEFVEEVKDLANRDPNKAAKVVIGKVMKEYRGKVDGKLVSDLVKKILLGYSTP